MKWFKTCLWLGALALIAAMAETTSAQSPGPPATILRVDGYAGVDNPVGLGNGWGQNAFKFLQDAIDRAINLPESLKPVAIWIRGDVPTVTEDDGLAYYPDDGDNVDDGVRTETFKLANQVRLYGGFAGNEVAIPGDPNGFYGRRPHINITVLSGDLDQDDEGGIDDPSRNENSFHVLKAAAVETTAFIDGFTIMGGNAIGAPDEPNPNGGFFTGTGGGGMIILSGGGFNPPDTRPRILRCKFIGNKGVDGGAVRCQSGDNPLFQTCEFRNNKAYGVGGAICHGEPLFAAPEAPCLAIGGTTLVCSLVADNEAVGGYALYGAYTGGIRVIQCTVTRNPQGGAYHEFVVVSPSQNQSCGANEVINTIVWNNGGSTLADQLDGCFSVKVSDVQGINETLDSCQVIDGLGIGQSFTAPPEFVEPDIGDYGLQETSPCIDRGWTQ